MRSYEDVVKKYAQLAYIACLNGSNEFLGGVDCGMIAFIYTTTYEQVVTDIKERLDSLCRQH